MRAVSMKYVLMVEDMSRAVAFYRDVFSLEVGLETPHWSELTLGDAAIGLHAGGTGRYQRTGLSIQVDDIEAATQTIVDHGGAIRMAPQDRENEPILLAEATDPEGNGISIVQLKPM